MWTKPGYEPQRPAPPQEQGTRLVCLDRPKGERLVMTYETFNGHDFIRCQVWAPGTDGRDYPVRGKCVTFKTREIGAILDGLQQAASLAGELARQAERGEHQGEHHRPAYVDKGRKQRPPFDPANLPSQQGGSGAFDEFEDSAGSR